MCRTGTYKANDCRFPQLIKKTIKTIMNLFNKLYSFTKKNCVK